MDYKILIGCLLIIVVLLVISQNNSKELFSDDVSDLDSDDSLSQNNKTHSETDNLDSIDNSTNNESNEESNNDSSNLSDNNTFNLSSKNSHMDLMNSESFWQNNPKINLALDRYLERYKLEIDEDSGDFHEIFRWYCHKLLNQYVLNEKFTKLSYKQKKQNYLENLEFIIDNMPNPHTLRELKNKNKNTKKVGKNPRCLPKKCKKKKNRSQAQLKKRLNKDKQQGDKQQGNNQCLKTNSHGNTQYPSGPVNPMYHATGSYHNSLPTHPILGNQRQTISNNCKNQIPQTQNIGNSNEHRPNFYTNPQTTLNHQLYGQNNYPEGNNSNQQLSCQGSQSDNPLQQIGNIQQQIGNLRQQIGRIKKISQLNQPKQKRFNQRCNAKSINKTHSPKNNQTNKQKKIRKMCKQILSELDETSSLSSETSDNDSQYSSDLDSNYKNKLVSEKKNLVKCKSKHQINARKVSSIKKSDIHEEGWMYLPEEVNKSKMFSNDLKSFYNKKQFKSAKGCDPGGYASPGFSSNMLEFKQLKIN